MAAATIISMQLPATSPPVNLVVQTVYSCYLSVSEPTAVTSSHNSYASVTSWLPEKFHTFSSYSESAVTMHTSQSSLSTVCKYLSTVGSIIRDPSSHLSPITHSRFSRRVNWKNTAVYTWYVHTHLPSSRPLLMSNRGIHPCRWLLVYKFSVWTW